ncbi:MAG: TolC family protein [Anaerovoracaceae bacterium]
MKKKYICGVLAMSLILGNAAMIADTGVCYGATTSAAATTGAAVTETTDSAIKTQPAKTESGIELPQLTETKKLSLAEAVKIMQTTGSSAETAMLHKESDVAVSKGYSETVQKIKKTEDKLDSLDDAIGYMQSLGMSQAQISAYLETNFGVSSAIELAYEAQLAGATSTNKNISKLRRDFANKNIENNYQAELNQIEADTISIYYKVLLAQDSLNIAKENLATQQKTLKNTEAKKAVGLLSKSDVLKAKSSVSDAESAVRNAETQLKYAKMSFNYLLGYNVMQDVVFTDSIKTVTGKDAPVEVEQAVKNALENRIELKGANHAVQVYDLLFKDVQAYPKNSATYLNAKIALTEAEKTAKDAYSKLEIDVRNKYDLVQDKKEAVKAAQELLDYATEGERLMRLTYEEGLSTVDQLLDTQVSLYKAKLNLANANSEYALALKSYEYAQGVGTTRLPL